MNSPDSLALALAFSINGKALRMGTWTSTALDPWGTANLHLLEAEALPQGHADKASLLNRAFRIYDSAELASYITGACDEANRLTASQADQSRVYRRFHDEVRAVLERAISDFGDDVDASELDLLEALEDAHVFPEVAGLSAALAEVVRHHTDQLVNVFNVTGEILKTREADEPIRANDAKRLVEEAGKALRILSEIARRPSLARRLDELVTAITHRLAFTAWQLGVDDGLWPLAAKLVDGLQSKHVQASDDLTRDACRAVIRIAPIMAMGTKQQRLAELDAVAQDYPRLMQHMLTLRTKVASERSAPPALPTQKKTASPQPPPALPAQRKTASSQGMAAKQPDYSVLRAFAACVAVIVVALIVFGAWNSGSPPEKPAAPVTYPVPSSTPARPTLEAERERANAVKEEQQRKLERQRLLNARGSIVIRTDPVDAAVTLDNRRSGRSPATFSDLQIGPHKVEISKAGFDTVRFDVVLNENEVNDRDPVALVRETGSLSIDSTPANSAFLIQEKPSSGDQPAREFRGVTPATISDLPTGAYLVTIQRPGWPIATQTVSVNSGATAYARQEFVAGTVIITSAPLGAEVFADNSSVGHTPLMLTDVTPGAVSYRIELRDYRPVTTEGLVRPGATLNLSASLEPVEKLARIADLDALPKPTKTVQPKLPKSARQLKGQKILISVVVDESEIPRDLRVIETPDPAIADLCLEAVSKWRFKPGTIAGRAVKVRVTIPITFE